MIVDGGNDYVGVFGFVFGVEVSVVVVVGVDVRRGFFDVMFFGGRRVIDGNFFEFEGIMEVKRKLGNVSLIVLL